MLTGRWPLTVVELFAERAILQDDSKGLKALIEDFLSVGDKE